MIISVNWLKKFVPDLPDIGELSKLIGARLVEIESIENLGEKYKNVIIAKVVSAQKVENSDHLNLCKIDDGGVRENIARDEDGFIQVVCGAPNVRAGIFVAWLPPESIVPETFGGENFKLGARKLMGYMSNGMIASLRELGLGDEHDGILEISPEVFEDDIQAGDYFAEKFELNDFLLEVENKSLTHRPDCFGIIGFAREVAGILGQKFKNPDWYFERENQSSKAVNIEVEIKDSGICEKYSAVILDASKILKNPALTVEKTYLLRSGMRPIDAITDLANELMLESAQPLHTFDFDKLARINGGENVKLTVRRALRDEELELLDGKKILMSENDIVIATGQNAEAAVALAGAMGGKSTAIDENTTRILVESATFNLYDLRNTQMRHGIFSEAITRFTKGQPAGAVLPVLDEFIARFEKNGGEKISQIVSIAESVNFERSPISVKCANKVLGKDFSQEEITQTLENVGFESFGRDKFIAPFWRTDIHIEEDLIEEIGRLNGYDEIPLQLPRRTFRAAKLAEIDLLKKQIREILAASGANEVLTYSFVHGDLIEKVGQNPQNSYKIVNSISPDLQFYRQTILPSLLAKVNQNIRAGFDEFSIFEINKTTHKLLGLNDENVPNESQRMAFVYANKKGEGAFYEVKNYANFIFSKLGVQVSFEKFNIDFAPLATQFEPKRAAILTFEEDGSKQLLGAIGEFKKSVQKNLKLPENSAGFEINLEKLLRIINNKKSLRRISKFQSVERDISLRVSRRLAFAQIFETLREKCQTFGDEVLVEISPIDIYKVDEKTKNVALRFKITPFNKTLSGDEIQQIMKQIEQEAGKKLNAEII
ncbi:MAG: phenylalanine--tRNA ligase subunit beta [bacterium]|nr:phenylalanine--tRNA ligase subunit beta [bacterium]